MNEKKKTPLGLIIIAIFAVIFEIWYYYPVILGTWPMMETIMELTPWSLFVYFNILLSIILIISVTYGFYKARNWARLYTIFYYCYSSFWALYAIFIMRWEIYSRYIFLIIYVVIIMYLLMSWVKEYFTGKTTSEDLFPDKPQVYRYGDYTLYKSEISTKKGGTRTFYYFSKEKSDKGEPCSLPETYIVAINKKTGRPFIKKK